MSIVGHRTARVILERGLPQATLLTGPPSIGKWTLAAHLAAAHHVAPVDHWSVPDGLKMETVELLGAFARQAPLGPFKLIRARIDASSKPALNALLKTLEEPPPRVKMILVSSTPTLPTVASRCVTFNLGLLNTDDLVTVYTQQGFSLPRARRAARHARGQVRTGYDVDSADDPKRLVRDVARAVAAGDVHLFDTAFKAWDARSTQLMITLLSECLTTRWSLFTEDDTGGLHHDRPRVRAIVTALGRLPAARPKLRVRAALEPFVHRR